MDVKHKPSAGKLAQVCQARKVRIRRHGLSVLTAFDGANDVLSSKDVFDRARAVNAMVSLSTVSRTLRDLCDAGVLRRTLRADGAICYAASSQPGQDHFVDIDSGEVRQLQDARLETAIRDAAAALGYELKSYRLDIFGRQAARKVVSLASRQRKSKLAGIFMLGLNSINLPWSELAQVLN